MHSINICFSRAVKCFILLSLVDIMKNFFSTVEYIVFISKFSQQRDKAIEDSIKEVLQ